MQETPKNNRATTIAYIGLGSNHGDRVGYIQQAMQLLKDTLRIAVVECSSLYETEPVGDTYTEWFVNAVAVVETDFSPEELLDVCRDIESRLNEVPAQDLKNGRRAQLTHNRIIDLDILFYGSKIINSDYLQVPHPKLHERAFALVPLLEIAPDLVHPGYKKTIVELHDALPSPELVFLYGTRGIA